MDYFHSNIKRHLCYFQALLILETDFVLGISLDSYTNGELARILRVEPKAAAADRMELRTHAFSMKWCRISEKFCSA